MNGYIPSAADMVNRLITIPSSASNSHSPPFFPFRLLLRPLQHLQLLLLLLLFFLSQPTHPSSFAHAELATRSCNYTSSDLSALRAQVSSMFDYSFDSYMNNAFPRDELLPLSCRGRDTFGGLTLSLIDTLDSLVVFERYASFARAVKYITKHLTLDIDSTVSVFEVTIRVLGGLLSAHALLTDVREHQGLYRQRYIMRNDFGDKSRTSSSRTSSSSRNSNSNSDSDDGDEMVSSMPLVSSAFEHSWLWLPDYDDGLLYLAVQLADRMLPAFNTSTGIPFGSINLRHGVRVSESRVASTAGAGSLLLEFGTLTRYTHNRMYYRLAFTAMSSLHTHRASGTNLVGNHINIDTGHWVATDAGVGGLIDSFYEYMFKGYILFGDPRLWQMFIESYDAISTYLRKPPWFLDADMWSGHTSNVIQSSLSAFFPGLQVLMGHVEEAAETTRAHFAVWRKFGVLPEGFDVIKKEPAAGRVNYPLRPELAEAIFYLQWATKDPMWIGAARNMLFALETNARTDCGYAEITHVASLKKGDLMPSFMMSETLKYLYLTFHPDDEEEEDIAGSRGEGDEGERRRGEKKRKRHWLRSGRFVFTTEAHPLPIAADEMEVVMGDDFRRAYSDQTAYDEAPVGEKKKKKKERTTTTTASTSETPMATATTAFKYNDDLDDLDYNDNLDDDFDHNDDLDDDFDHNDDLDDDFDHNDDLDDEDDNVGDVDDVDDIDNVNDYYLDRHEDNNEDAEDDGDEEDDDDDDDEDDEMFDSNSVNLNHHDHDHDHQVLNDLSSSSDDHYQYRYPQTPSPGHPESPPTLKCPRSAKWERRLVCGYAMVGTDFPTMDMARLAPEQIAFDVEQQVQAFMQQHGLDALHPGTVFVGAASETAYRVVRRRGQEVLFTKLDETARKAYVDQMEEKRMREEREKEKEEEMMMMRGEQASLAASAVSGVHDGKHVLSGFCPS